MPCHSCSISPPLLHPSVLGFFAFGSLVCPALIWDPVVASFTGSDMRRAGICHELISPHEQSPLHDAVAKPQGRNSNPEKKTKIHSEIQIKGFENTGKYVKQFPLLLTFHKCFAMTPVNSQHVFASCSGEKCLPDGFFLLI